MKKKIIAVIIIIIVLAAAAITAIFINKPKQDKQDEKVTEKITHNVSKIPAINVYYGNEQTGTLTGYVTKMDTVVLRDHLIIVKSDERKAEIKFAAEEVNIQSVKYEVKTNDGDRLIDSGDVDGFQKGEKEISGNIPVSAILENNREYSLIIILDTEELGEIYYYSRIMVVEEDFVTEQIQFAKKFSDDTMDSEAARELAIYLEPDAELFNNNLGQVTLKNNYDLLTWGNLSPKKVGETKVQLKESYVKDTGVSGTYQMTYQVEAEGNNDIVDTYDVIETITVWTFNSQQYVLAYERDMNQAWTTDTNTVNSTFLDLGIQKDTIIDYKQSKEGKYIAYVVNDSLWILDLEQKKFINVCSLDEEQKQKTKILTSVLDDSGNMEFIVCGYSTDKAHIGMNGISVRHYDMETNKVEEKIFLPYDQPVDILAEQVGSLCYLNDDVLYLMIGHTVNYVNLLTKETGIITDKLEDGNYAINADQDTIAYNTNGSLYNSDSITISDLSNGTNKVIEAGDGNKIRVCGYSGNNLVYGVASENQINTKKGKNIFHMSSITILDGDLKELTTYTKKNIYISDVEITDTIINLKRLQNGSPAEDDQLIDNTEKLESVASSSYYDDTKKYRELALSLKKSLSTSMESVVSDHPEENIMSEVVEPIREETNQEFFYVYASGKLKEIYNDQTSAEQAAKEYGGLVIDNKGEKIWTFEENYDS